MKTLFTLFFLLIFLGCSQNNAFTNFKMDKYQELATANLQISKIKLGEAVDGVFSAIYLNNVYPNAFTQNEYFFISIYLKEESKIYNPKILLEEKLKIKLNGKLPIKIVKLPTKNKFSKLILVSSEWYKYYLVSFEKESLKLSLSLENGQSVSDQLKYQKDE